ncbi:MAG: hypothetical protein AMXMBFR84_37550 [Candidatus Hydrogenedentota bacterium]
MFLRKVRIQNFCGVEHLEVSFRSQSSIVMGFNRQGKTTLMNAIRYAFFGECYDEEGVKQKQDDLIGRWDKTALIYIEFERSGEPYRYTVSLGNGGAQCDLHGRNNSHKSFTPTNASRFFSDLFEFDMAHARIAAFSNEIVKGDITEFVSRFVSIVTPEEVKQFAGPNWAKLNDWCKENAVTITDVAHIGAKAREFRTVSNREAGKAKARLEEIGTCIAPTSKDGTRILTADDRPAIETAVKNLEAQLEELNREFGAATAVKIDTKKVTAAKAALAGAESERDSVKKVLDEYDEGITSVESEIKVMTSNQSRAHGEMSGWQAKRDVIESEIDRMKGLSHCPTCTAEWTLDRLEAATKTLRIEADKAAQEIAGYQSTLADIGKELAKKHKRLDQLRTLRADHEPKYKALVDKVSELKAQARLMGIPVGGADPVLAQAVTRKPDEIEALIEQTKATVQEGRDKLAALSAYLDYQRVITEVDRHTADSKFLDWLVKSFDNGEFQSKQSGSGLDDVVKRCNSILSVFDLELKVASSNKKSVIHFLDRLQDNPPWLPITKASRSARMKIQFALSLGFDAGWLRLMDDSESIEAKYKQSLLDLMKSLCGKQGSTIVSGVVTNGLVPDLEKLNKAFNPVGVYWVQAVNSESAQAAVA